jgi:serine protease AprX
MSMTRGTYLLKGVFMSSLFSAQIRPARSWRALAGAGLAVALVLPVGATSGAAGSAAEGPLVRQLAFWADGSAAGTNNLTAQLRTAGATVVARLSIADAVLVEVPSTWQPPVGVATAADRPMNVSGGADSSTKAQRSSRGPDRGWADSLDGDGVTVALVDTGVADVPDLRGSVQHVNVSGAAKGDGYGHGTFLAGLIASSGASSGGLYPGVAPKTGILDVQVAAADGSTSLFRVLAGLQAVAERARHDSSLRVVNLSLSADDPGAPGIDPLSRALEGLWDRGLVVVVAAGNDGPDAGTVSVPGTDPAVITVGALDTKNTETAGDDVVAPFSARGIAGDPNAKPDLVAPGVSTVGLRAPGSVIDTDYPTARVGSTNFRGSGTSMATAFVSGAVAGLLSALPDLDPEDVKDALTQGAYDVAGDSTATGAGGLDLVGAKAAAQQLTQDHAPWAGRDVAAAYDRFAAAWRNGSRSAAITAWLQLPASLRARIASDWATSVAGDEGADYEHVNLARVWAQDRDLGANWLARTWSARTWSARTWSSDVWLARTWSARTWSARTWSARTWSSDDWAARTWSARTWSARTWSARTWSARTWSVEDWGTSSP